MAYSCDLLGRPTGVATAAQTLGFTYAALGRLVTQSGLHGTVTSQYDVAGRRTRLIWVDGFYVSYDHRVTGELTTIARMARRAAPACWRRSAMTTSVDAPA